MKIPKNILFNFLFCFVLALSFAQIIILSHNGVGDSPDYVLYLGVAHNVLHDQWITVPFGVWSQEMITHYPPLYPLSIAFFSSVTDTTIFYGARILNALLFSGQIGLVILILRRLRPSLGVAVYLAAGIVMFSTPFLSLYSASASEPMMLFFGQISLITLYEYAVQKKRWYLYLCIVSLWFATLSRYVGIAYLITVTGYLVFILKSDRKTNIMHGVSSAIGFIPISLWIIFTIVYSGRIADRVLLFHPITFQQLQEIVYALAAWVNRYDRIPYAAFIALFGIMWVGFCPRTRISSYNSVRKHALRIFDFFIFIYGVFIVFSALFIDAALHFDDRLLLPLQLVLIIYLFSIVRISINTRSRITACVLSALIGTIYVWSGVMWYQDRWENGVGFTASTWQHAAIFPAIRQLKSESVIYTNSPELIFLYSSYKSSLRLPFKYSSTSLQRNPDYDSQLTDLVNDMIRGHTYIVFFRGINRNTLVSEEEIKSRPRIYSIIDSPEGTIYGAR